MKVMHKQFLTPSKLLKKLKKLPEKPIKKILQNF